MDRETFARGLQVTPIGRVDRRSRERYHAKQQVQGRVKPKRNTKNMKKILATVGLTGLIAVGSIKGYQFYQEQTQTINLEQALQMGKDIQTLGLTPELVERMETVGDVLEEPDTLSNVELMEIGDEIRDIQKEVIHTKLQAVTGQEDIQFRSRDKNDGRCSVKIGDTTYWQDDIFNVGEKEISDNIIDQFESYHDYSSDINKMNYQDLYRKSYIKKITKQMGKVEKFAAGEISIDEKGNITMEQTKQKEYEKMFREKETNIAEER